MLVFMATPIEKAGKIKVKPINRKHQPKLRSTSDLACPPASRHYSLDSHMAPVKRSDTTPSSERSSLASESSGASGLSRSCSFNEIDKTKLSPIMKKPRVKLKRSEPVLRSQLRQPVINKSQTIRVVSDYIELDENTESDFKKVAAKENSSLIKHESVSNAIGRSKPISRSQIKQPVIGKSQQKRVVSDYIDTDDCLEAKVSEVQKSYAKPNKPGSKYARKRHSVSSAIERNPMLRAKRSNSTGSILDLPPQSYKSSIKRLNSTSFVNKTVSFKLSNRSLNSRASSYHSLTRSNSTSSIGRSVSSKNIARPISSPSRSNSLKTLNSRSLSSSISTSSRTLTRRTSSPSRSGSSKSFSSPSRAVSFKGSHNRLSPGLPSHNSYRQNSPSHKSFGKTSNNSLTKQNSVDEIAQYVIKQCRIGPDVAFGLVHVNNNYNNHYNKPTSNGFTDGHGLVTIRMKPDEQGRFGFNVKGGADQGMPIIVSRVAPNTPADLSIPRLNEGDQVLFINGRDMSQHTHEQVVMFIKASRETHSGELVVMVRPNVYVGEDVSDEPDFSYTPETHTIASSNTTNTLQSSLLLLQESLESGAALAQFEQLYRKKPNMSMNCARLECNISKNRYRDISPYDQTRVVLKGSPSGDYVNANFVNMEIPGSGIVNRYIAAQGPLQNTCTDFWQMIWEQQCTLVVMLTTKVERGRVKCHQYWPELYETQDFGALQITCVKEEDATSFAFREFNLTHVETNEERHIRHMQYISWPDHGVPDDPGDFLQFVVRVRQNRAGMVEPTVVHCSAGIGRTGVLITMETAMCLIEANQPCYPLQIVKNMRDQRAMLIQTSSQYKFVCEAILRVYHEGIVKPVDDFQR